MFFTSAWHFFHGAAPGDDEAAKKTAFIRSALPSLNDGARAMIEMEKRDAAGCMMVTYEALKAAPPADRGSVIPLPWRVGRRQCRGRLSGADIVRET